MERVLRRRRDLLEALRDNPSPKPEIVDRTAVSRSTVDRGITELVDRGCVRKVDSQFRLTETGRLALEARLEYERAIDQIQTAGPLLAEIDLESLSLEFLRGATVNVADPRRPWKVLDQSSALVDEATTMYGTGPAVFRKFYDDIDRSVENHGLTCELVIDEAVFESLDSAQREELRELLRRAEGTLLRTELTDSFAIWILEYADREYAGITVYSSGGFSGVIYNDAPNAVSWARTQYRKRKASAELLWDFR
ncbi:helix-turn-helix transcriptional regulator [Halostagnicola kamekurae]|uniref:Predicted transcriptional regulator, contains HTH domain n=1 Tax=Halostagnicola kamekurae TaxID=619731 RepID=A0A1I6U487_9EURY|nr:MarR family transcriptional regulator [Halostagnicola kamekurae]SFS96188.1 Predicted transcriptional regulator, contains HTH domain [Halostagnicola kamekurae]